MDIQATRLELIKLLLEEKRESVLLKVSEILTTGNQVVAHNVVGEPLTVSEYNSHLEDAEKDIESGRVIDHEDLKTKIKSWQ